MEVSVEEQPTAEYLRHLEKKPLGRLVTTGQLEIQLI